MVSSRTSSALSAGRALMLSLGAVMLYGCSGALSCGGGSSCLNGYAYPQTQALVPNGVQAVDDGVRMRMTQAGLDFVAVHMKELMLAVFDEDPARPGTLRLDLPPQDIISTSYGTVNLGEGPEETYPTGILIDADELSNQMTITFVESPDGIRVSVADVPVGLDSRVFGEVDIFGFSPNAACDVYGTSCPASDPNCGIITTLSFDLLVIPDVGVGAACDLGQGECLKIRVEVESFALGDIDAGSLAISLPPFQAVDNGDPNGCTLATAPDRCSPTCSDHGSFDPFDTEQECSTLCGAVDLVADITLTLSGILIDLVEPILAPLLQAGIQQALADFDGAPVSASNRLDLAAFAPGALSPTTLDLGYSISPTGNAFDVNCPAGNCNQTRGMDFILKSGFEAAPDPTGQVSVPHPCVLPYRGVDFNALYGIQGGEFETNTNQPLTGELGGTAYHIGASLAEPAVNQMMFGAYNTGALCIELTSDGVHGLTGGAFPLSAGTIDLLTEGKLRQFAQPTAPAIVAVNPLQPPIVTYGAGTLDQGHIQIEWPHVEVSFYVLMYERYARVFAVATDISMALTVFNDPETQTLHISVVDGPNVENFEEKYNELLPGVDFTEILESLIGLAFDAALGDGLEFDYDVANILSTSLGVPLYIDFRGIETLPVAEPEFLNVYLSLTATPPQPATAPAQPIVIDRNDGLYAAPTIQQIGDVARRARPDAPAPRAHTTGELRVTGRDTPLDAQMEYFALVDFGSWKGPFRVDDDGALLVKDPKLALVGQHRVMLRGRFIGAPNSLVPYEDAAELHVWTDPEAPRVTLALEGAQLVARGSDVGTKTAQLVWAWRTGDGDWTDFGDASTRRYEDVSDARRVSVRAMDLAGNVSQQATVDLAAARAAAQRAGVVLGDDGGGCSATTTRTAGTPAAALALLGLVCALRRRRA